MKFLLFKTFNRRRVVDFAADIREIFQKFLLFLRYIKMEWFHKF